MANPFHTPPTPNTPEPMASVTPKLRMCLKRSDDHFVPLIAIDELPSWITLKGVPMTLRGEEVLRLGLMMCGGYSRTNDEYYQVEQDGKPAQAHSRSSAATRGTTGTLGEKVYCTFWCRTGCCDYTQVGCKFLHEIPLDEATRNAMGLRDYPTWMLEKPRGPMVAKTSSVDRIQEGNWRRGKAQDNQGVLPASPTPSHGRTLSHIVPYSGRVQTSSLTQTPTMAPTNTGGQASNPRIPAFHKHQGAQQAALFLPTQQYFPSSTGSVTQTRPQMQPNTFDGADGSMSLPSSTSAGQETFQSQYPANELFSNATVVATNERRPVPATQPPISRPVPNANMSLPSISSAGQETFQPQYPANDVFSDATVVATNERQPVPATQPPISRPVPNAQAQSTSQKGYATTKPTMYMPSQNTAYTVPQVRAPAGSNTINSTDTMKANQQAFSTNGSGRSTSRTHTPASSDANNNAAGNGADQTLSSLVNGSTPSPPIMHRRLFVPPGEPQYMPNSIHPVSSKPPQQSRSRRGANAKGRGGKAGQPGKAQGKENQEENLVEL